jgi:hypothetical protein
VEVPKGAVLRDGAWHYRPALPPQIEAVFADAGRGAGDWRLCDDAPYRNVGDLVPSRDSSFTLTTCEPVGVELFDVPPPHDPTR